MPLAVLLVIVTCFGIRYVTWLQAFTEAQNYVKTGKFEKAKKKALESLRLMSTFPDGRSYALNLRFLSSIYMCRGMYEESQLWNERLLEFARKTWGEKSAEYADALCDLAYIKDKQINYPAAEKLCQQVISILSKNPARKADAAKSKAFLAWILIEENKNEEALELIEDSDNFLSEKFGELSSERLIGLIDRIWLYYREDKIRGIKGAAFYAFYPIEPSLEMTATQTANDIKLAYKICTEQAGLNNSSAQNLPKSALQSFLFLKLFAQVFIDVGNHEKALKIFEIAEENCRTHAFGGLYNSSMADLLISHGKLLQLTGEKEKAEELFARAKRIREIQNP